MIRFDIKLDKYKLNGQKTHTLGYYKKTRVCRSCFNNNNNNKVVINTLIIFPLYLQFKSN
ncbi:hypothetical protein HanOQP8_Chr12g0462061 [Helianthus annuus]|nr:hypothetical protein HanOQP8_Chr12g0462061 [Helianthus annuus]